MLRTALRLALTSVLLTSSSAFVAGCAVQTTEDAVTDDSESEALMSNNQKTAYNFFVSKGLKNYQAAAIVGNLMQEPSVNPNAKQYGGGPGRGIAQWSIGGRWNHDAKDNVVWYANAHGESPYALTTQLDFIWYELQTFSGFGLSELKSSSTLTQAVTVFQNKYEICGSCAQGARVKFAQQVLSDYGNGGGGGGTASCYSGTLGKSVPHNTCVESKFDKLWYQCDNGGWVDRWSDPEACSSVHPL